MSSCVTPMDCVMRYYTVIDGHHPETVAKVIISIICSWADVMRFYDKLLVLIFSSDCCMSET